MVSSPFCALSVAKGMVITMKNNSLREIYLAGGCFWGTESYLSNISGVLSTEVGFVNGNTPTPSYEDVCKRNTGHAEAVRVEYDSEQLALADLLDFYYEAIDPSSLNRQGGDVGSQYRTGIYFTDPADEATAHLSVSRLRRRLDKPIAIEILPLAGYHPADESHQKYLAKNPNGYCHLPSSLFQKVYEESRELLGTGAQGTEEGSVKKAILVVSFGTSHRSTLEKTIAAIEDDIRAAFPGYAVKRAFTSKIIIRKLKAELQVDSVFEALEKLEQEGYSRVICQPTHVINGLEFDDMVRDASSFENKFDSLEFSNPLLTSHQDFTNVVTVLKSEFSGLDNETALVLLGHGTTHYANAAYAALDYRLKAEGCPNFFVATVEGYPDMETVLRLVQNTAAKRVLLAPLMVVAGEHATHDMAGDENSWKSEFMKAGYEVDLHLKGLGEYPDLRKIYLAHIDAIL